MKTLSAAAILALASIILTAYSFGPPNAHTGAPDEQTCGLATCHANLNTGPGMVSLDGAEIFLPGDTLSFTIRLQQQGQKRWGFELTVLDGNLQPSGTLLVTDRLNTQRAVDALTRRQYLKQTEIGTHFNAADASPGWQFAWIAPATGASQAIFYLAANAANGNFDNSGDFIYTTVKTLMREATGVAGRTGEASSGYVLEQNYPNPFNPSTTIAYHLPRAEHVKLTIYEITGIKVVDLVDGRQSAGHHKVAWSAHQLPAGVYLAKIIAGDFVATRRMLLLK